MSTSGKHMLGVDEARKRAAARYKRQCREWAAGVFAGKLRAAGLPAEDPAPAQAAPPARFARQPEGALHLACLDLNLHPPTEQQALQAGSRVRAWADEWRACSASGAVEWEQRQWPRLGAQTLPARLHLDGVDAIAAFAGRARHWRTACQRMDELADCLSQHWGPQLAGCDAGTLRAAVRSQVETYVAMEPVEWGQTLQVLGWLAGHEGGGLYARQLPVRGIDTKWMEGHKGAIAPVHEALSGRKFVFARPPYQARVHFLDRSLAPGGLVDVSAPPAQLALLEVRPRVAIVCENLVNVLALPDKDGAIAIHGGGYAVNELAAVGWLADVRVLYWGDLDSHGFAILSELRGHFPHVESVMMDAATLQAHRELCVPEEKPTHARCANLTPGERETLALLLAETPALRLEQERIEWGYALGCLEDALSARSDIDSCGATGSQNAPRRGPRSGFS